MGDLGMIKEGLLAWKLCRHKRICYGEVVIHRIISALGVYRREEGEETNKYTATKQSQSMTTQIATLGVI